ncbi:MAG: alpha/beta hydrolase [Myxococcota bacterium]
MSERVGPLLAERWRPPAPVRTAVLLHGIGLGPWFWEPWALPFVAAGVEAVALALPGHDGERADVGLAACVDAVEAALDTFPGPVALVGHSMGGLVAQLVATRRALAGLALVCALPPGNVFHYTTRAGLRGAGALARDVLAGRPVVPGWDTYRGVGLAEIEEARAREVFDRIVPWPNRLVRELALRRPVLDPLAVRSPVLVALGARDRLVDWRRARVLGDLYEGTVWRYDDVGHMPPWEPGGERMGRDVAAWCAAPARPVVLESEGFGPGEGVGTEVRRRRRGEEAKKRSAYGQKRSAR